MSASEFTESRAIDAASQCHDPVSQEVAQQEALVDVIPCGDAQLSDHDQDVIVVEASGEQTDVVAAEVPAQEAPVQEAPVQEAPVQEAPVQEAPVQEAPVQEAPVQEAPVQEAPVQKGTAKAKEQESREPKFADLPLSAPVQQAIERSGYQTPTPVQAQIIPHMLDGRDVLAQSQTGTGKTAAFALPILSRIDLGQRRPQILVLAPTRELAIQVANSFETYASCLDGLNVATIYGGQSYEPQLRQLRRGAQIVVGTPGRVIDHINQGTLDLGGISCLVLDEADEMLNMGFLEDVEFVLGRTPNDRQIALFSATLPGPIQSIAEQYLNDPVKITVKKKTMTADSIRQRALFVAPRDKVYALGRILEAEATDGIIVFTKTKAATLSVAESLCRDGRSAVALNGDMPQAARERTVEQFKSGRLDILVATDVAARGLDVSRVSHVVNFDLPHDVESYIHRVGRTGRAGRDGEAIIFLSNSQRSRLRTIERATKQRIDVMQLPTADDINQLRIQRFQQRITDVTANEDLTMFKELISLYASESGKSLDMIAAALAHIHQDGRPFLTKDRPKRERREQRDGRDRFQDEGSNGSRRGERPDGHRKGRKPGRQLGPPEAGMERYRIEVGRRDGVKPGNIVGAVANEAGIDGDFIGPISIHDFHSTIDLPEGMPRGIYQSLRRTWVVGKQLQIAREGEGDSNSSGRRDFRPKDRKHDNPRGKRNGKPGGGFGKGKSAKPPKGKVAAKGNVAAKRSKRKSPSA
ncbi:MAG: DEAD/DEAH box helicase [Rubripirellula sp.]